MQPIGRASGRFNLIMLLTLAVFLTPFVMQLTENNMVKLAEDAAYGIFLLVSLYKLLMQNNFMVRRNRLSVILLFLVFIMAMIGIYYNGLNLVILQFREFKYLLLALILIPYRDVEYYKPVWPIVKIIAFICVPVSLYQWFAFQREGDAVTGILGHGSSGTLTILLLIIVFSEFGRRLQEERPILGFYLLYLLPTALNETKIIFVLIPLMMFFTLLFTGNLKSGRTLMVFLVITLMLAGWAIIYDATYDNSMTDFFSSDSLEEYLYSTDWEADAGRFAKVNFAFAVIREENLLFGYGLGASYIGISSGRMGYAAEHYYAQNMFSGTKPQVFLSLLDSGLVGSLLILAILVAFFVKVLRSDRHSPYRLIAMNTYLVVFATLLYQNIFYTYQIMFLLTLFTIVQLKFHCDVKEENPLYEIRRLRSGLQ